MAEKPKSIKKNYIYNLIYQILLVVAPLIVTPYVSRVLQPTGIGIQSYSASIVSYFTLVAVLGTATFGQKAIGTLQTEAEARSRQFWEIFLVRLITTVVSALFYILYVFVLVPDNAIVALIFGIQLLGTIVDISWFFQGMEEFGKISLSSIFFRIANIVCIFLFVKTADDLNLYVFFSVIFIVGANLSLWLYLPKYLVKVKRIRPFRDIKDVLQLFIPSVAVQIYTVLDKSMIGWLTEGSAENGYYEQAEKVVKMALSVVSSLGTVVMPRIAQKFKQGDDEAVKFYIYKLYRCIMLAGVPMAFGLIVISDVFVPVFFGSGYEKCIPLLCIFSLLTIFIGLNSITNSQYLVPTNRQNVFTVIVIIGAVVNCALNAVLIPLFQAIGACIASVIGEFVVMLAGFLYVWKKKLFAISPIFKTSVKYWIAAIIMFVPLFFIKKVMPVNVIGLIALIAIGVVVYFLMLLILRDELFLELLKKMFGKIGKLFKREKVAVENDSSLAEQEAAVADAQAQSDTVAEEDASQSGPASADGERSDGGAEGVAPAAEKSSVIPPQT
ncbi:MAG TPA: flippase [Firmicutes bacterium]|nr:flippase [Bacillota bacterium]